MREQTNLRLRLFAASAVFIVGASVSRAVETNRPTQNEETKGVTLPQNDQVWRIGWPTKAGPAGNFTPLPTDTPLVDDLTQARILWISDSHLFGWGKTGSTGYRHARTIEWRIGKDYVTPPGSWAGPIVGDGKVFGVACRPKGKLYEAWDYVKKSKARFYFDADDILVALDAATGKQLWVAQEPDGMLIAAGKRGGFGVAPVYREGVVYWMSGSGRLYAHRSKDGRHIWRNDFVSEGRLQAREKTRATIQQTGMIALPPTPNWHTALVVCGGVLIAPTFETDRHDRGGRALAGIDLKTGRQLWKLPAMLDHYATPSVWKHRGKEYLLTASSSGNLRLTDPQEGTILWVVSGLGRSSFNLPVSQDGVIVNVRMDPEYGLYGYYRLSPQEPQWGWKLPDRPENYFTVTGDKNARIRPLMRDGLVYLQTSGYREKDEKGRYKAFQTAQRGYFHLVDEKTGKKLQTHTNTGKRDAAIGEMTLVLGGGKLITRADHSHGPTHGGRHPMFMWRVDPSRPIEVIGNAVAANALDLTDFATGYHTLMELPVVDGRMFERLLDGRVACVDLRRVPGGYRTVKLELPGGFAGVPAFRMPLELTLDADSSRVLFAKSRGPTPTEVGLIATQNGPTNDWNRCVITRGGVLDDHLELKLDLNFGCHYWPTTLAIERDGDAVTGTWSRPIPALAKQIRCRGEFERFAGPYDVKGVATPWLKDQPFTTVADNPPGVKTYELLIAAPFAPPFDKHEVKHLLLYLDVSEDKIHRLAGMALRTTQSWVEFDSGTLKVNGQKAVGEVVAVFSNDLWQNGATALNPGTGTGAAMSIKIDVDLAAKKGAWESVYGVEHTLTGPISGTCQE
jgi:outer membrane protein assembly factor BamB